MKQSKLKRLSAFFIGEMEQAMAYRGAFFTSFLADVVATLVKLFVWIAVFQQRSTVAGFTYPMMITYLLISQTINNIYAFKNDASRTISTKIRKGTIVFDLLRPVDFVNARLSENLGQTLLQVIFSFCMLGVFSLFFPELSGPASVGHFCLFVISLVLSYIIMLSVCLLSGLLSFWLMNNWGIRNVRMALVSFLSGALVPISMLPGWMRVILEYLPFKGIIYTPTMIYMGQYGGNEMLLQLCLQLFWAAFMWIGTRMLFAKAVKRVTVNGG